jgi:hypothetical protein
LTVFLRQLQDVFALNPAAQQQGQQFGVAQRRRATAEQLFTRPGFWWQVFEQHA